MQKFQIKEAIADQIRALRYDPEAKPWCCIEPFGGIYWPDEFPNGEPTIRGCPASKHFVLRIYLIRAEYWESGTIKADDLTIWQQAQEMFPDWPLFKRMKISKDEFRFHKQCQEDP